MAEMFSGKPLFPGKENDDQLLRIFKLLGTPSEESWPRVSEYSGYKQDWPLYPPVDLRARVPNIDAFALDLLNRMLQYQPQLRISAKDALSHPYFRDIMQVQLMIQQSTNQSVMPHPPSDGSLAPAPGYPPQ